MLSKKALAIGILVTIGSFSGAKATDASLENNSPNKQDVLISAVKTAIERFEQTPRENWAFTLSRYENEEGDETSSLEKYNPNSDTNDRWSLIKLNGESPTRKQIKKFLKQKRKIRQRDDDDKALSIQLSELIKLESLRFVSESDREINATFNVQLERLGKKAQIKLQGRLLYNKHLQFVENIVIINKEEFSPMFTATISDFELSIHFIRIDGAVLVREQNLNMKGTFAFFTEIDEVSTDKFFEYRCVAANSTC